MGNSIFKLVYFIELILISVVRGIGTSKYRKLTTEVDRTTVPDQILLGLNGIAMILPLFYIFSSWFDFADFTPDQLDCRFLLPGHPNTAVSVADKGRGTNDVRPIWRSISAVYEYHRSFFTQVEEIKALSNKWRIKWVFWILRI